MLVLLSAQFTFNSFTAVQCTDQRQMSIEVIQNIPATMQLIHFDSYPHSISRAVQISFVEQRPIDMWNLPCMCSSVCVDYKISNFCNNNLSYTVRGYGYWTMTLISKALRQANSWAELSSWTGWSLRNAKVLLGMRLIDRRVVWDGFKEGVLGENSLEKDCLLWWKA